MTLYGASTIKRQRRTRGELDRIDAAIIGILNEDHPMTLRGLFYRLVSAGIVGKTEAEYKNTGRYLLNLRRSGRVPYSFIADNTRWMRKPTTYTGLRDALDQTARFYRRSIWTEQDAYVEIWCEKNALAGVLYEETVEYDVPLMVVAGFSSETYLYEAAQAIRAQDKPAYLYLLTDYDPSGLGIASDIEGKIRGFTPDTELHVDRIAVTPDQITAWGLPTRPTKKTDSRAKGFTGESVELDAIPPSQLRGLVRDAIERHIDIELLQHTKQAEQLEFETLVHIRNRFAYGDDAA